MENIDILIYMIQWHNRIFQVKDSGSTGRTF